MWCRFADYTSFIGYPTLGYDMSTTESKHEILFQDETYELRDMTEDHRENYSICASGLYVEFSEVSWLGDVWKLTDSSGENLTSLNHNLDKREKIPDELHEILDRILYTQNFE